MKKDFKTKQMKEIKTFLKKKTKGKKRSEQGSTIGVHCIHTYSYFHWHTHDFGHAYVVTSAPFFPMIF